MPKIKEKISLSKRQHRRLVEKKYQSLSITTQGNQPTICGLSTHNVVNAATVLSLDFKNLDDNLDVNCQQDINLNCSFRSNSGSASTTQSIQYVETFDNGNDDSCQNITDNESNFPNITERNFQDDLRDWAVTRNITHAHVDALLVVLRTHGFKVPRDARTLVKTATNLAIIEMTPGHYYHFGLRSGLLQSISDYYLPGKCPSELKINVNIDGLPLTKSSGSQFWPILAAVEADFQTVPFVIGIYHGYQKPHDSNEFLQYFVNDLKNVLATGITIENQLVEIKLNAIVCDAPAKAYICGIKGHNAYFGCGKCIQEGEFIDNRVTYPEVDATLRTNESFREKAQEEHHKKISILETLSICMISIFPLDYLHLVCLGIMKKLVQFWVKGKKNVRMTNENLMRASNHLVTLNSSISKEFARKARPLQEIDRFKATELRQLLMYTRLLIFRDTLTKNQYNHFLSLSIAIRILSSQDLHLKYNNYAKNLLIYFVKSFPLLYGYQYLSYNVHNLVHLADDVKLKGPLDKLSTFKFENHMQKIKKMVKSSNKPLQQFVKRHKELDHCNTSSMHRTRKRPDYPIIKYHRRQHSGKIQTIKCIQYEAFFFNTKTPNNCCCMTNRTVIILDQIHLRNGKIYFRGKTFSNSQSLFTSPCESSNIGIVVVSNEQS